MKTLQWIKARLKEESTWRGGVQFVGGSLAMWFIFRSPSDAIGIVTGVLMLTGVINVAKTERPHP